MHRPPRREGAWTYRMQARVSRRLHDRIDGLPRQPGAILD
jgi:hypothetical protein